jgi:hypothetical protein
MVLSAEPFDNLTSENLVAYLVLTHPMFFW